MCLVQIAEVNKGSEAGNLLDNLTLYFEAQFNQMTHSLISQIISNPNILWQRRFLQQIGILPLKQKNVII
jgi:hypothetical protein